MKRAILYLLVLALAASACTGCGRKPGGGGNTGGRASYDRTAPSSDSSENTSKSSIIGKGDMTTAQMARDYTVTHVFTVENDEMSYVKK